MKERRNILGWLGMAEEDSVIKDAERHIEEVRKTVAHFADAVEAFVKGDLSGKTLAIENVRQSEHEADQIRIKMIKALTDGVLLPPHREELMRFAKNVDKIADWTKGASRLLGFIEEKLPDNILKNISISTELIVDSVDKLRDVVRAMSKDDYGKALEGCNEIDRLEHQADDQKRALIEAIIRAKLDATNLLLTYNLAETLEGVTDMVETSAEQIKIVAVKSR